MCGIAGYFGTKPLDQEKIAGTLKLMKHRGPDHAAFKSWVSPQGKHVSLLHTRLSIIDLEERSNQPLGRDRRWLAFNGEVYNYVELRLEQHSRGARFKTQSDTEVLLDILSKEGWKGLERCEGMWAFAFYDEKKGSLTLGRDRFGEKPLYIYRDKEDIYFASEIKFIVRLLGKKLRVNYDHLYRYLVNGYKALYKKPHAFFKGLEELEAGAVRIYESGKRFQMHRYWTPSFEPNEDMSYDEAVRGARERIIKSVELRLRADVPLAFCMSGGIDSSALISTAKRVFDYDVHGFTIANVDARYEEQDMIDCMVKELDIRHTSIPVNTHQFLPKLKRLVHQHDSPVYTITYYAQWLLIKAIASRGYKISISGTAADELFAGYYDHHLAYLQEVSHEPALHAASKEAWQEHIEPIVRNPFLKNPDLFVERPDRRDHIYLNANEFSGFLREWWSESFFEEEYTNYLLRKRMMNEMFHEAVPAILHEDDLNSMSYSVENRSPFLDRNLFEFCYTIPTKHLIQEGRSKAVLRDAMKGIIPEPVRTNRRKVGFNAPIFSFLDVKDPSVRSYLLNDSPIFDHVKKRKIESILSKTELPNSESKFLFYFLSSKLFLEAFDT